MKIPYCGWDKNIGNNITEANGFDFLQLNDEYDSTVPDKKPPQENEAQL